MHKILNKKSLLEVEAGASSSGVRTSSRHLKPHSKADRSDLKEQRKKCESICKLYTSCNQSVPPSSVKQINTKIEQDLNDVAFNPYFVAKTSEDASLKDIQSRYLGSHIDGSAPNVVVKYCIWSIIDSNKDSDIKKYISDPNINLYEKVIQEYNYILKNLRDSNTSIYDSAFNNIKSLYKECKKAFTVKSKPADATPTSTVKTPKESVNDLISRLSSSENYDIEFLKKYLKVQKPDRKSCTKKGDFYLRSDSDYGVYWKTDEDGNVIIKALDDAWEEYKKATNSEDNVDKTQYSKFIPLRDNITGGELQEYSKSLINDLENYLKHPEQYMGDELGKDIHNQIKNYISPIKNKDIPEMSGLNATELWFNRCWQTISPDTSHEPPHGNMQMIEAYYLFNIKGINDNSQSEIVNAVGKSLKNKSSAAPIKSAVFSYILSHDYKQVWAKVEKFYMDEILKETPDTTEDELKTLKKQSTSSKLTNKNQLTVGGIISSKFRDKNGIDSRYNWRIVKFPSATTIKLRLVDIYCNGQQLNFVKPFNAEIGKEYDFELNDIMNDNFYAKKYDIGEIVENIKDDTKIGTDITQLTFDNLCQRFNKLPEIDLHFELDRVNKIATELKVNNSLDNLVVLEIDSEKYNPIYLDFSDIKEYNGFTVYSFYSKLNKLYKVAVIYEENKMELFFSDDESKSDYLNKF